MAIYDCLNEMKTIGIFQNRLLVKAMCPIHTKMKAFQRCMKHAIIGNIFTYISFLPFHDFQVPVSNLKCQEIFIRNILANKSQCYANDCSCSIEDT